MSFFNQCSLFRSLTDELFATGTGVSDEEIRKILNSKPSKANKWELKKQLDAVNQSLKKVKSTTNSLMRTKNKFVDGALEAEKTAKSGWLRALNQARQLDEERKRLKEQMKRMEQDNSIIKDSAKDTQRELNLSREKMKNMEAEMEVMRSKLSGAEREHTQASNQTR